LPQMFLISVFLNYTTWAGHVLLKFVRQQWLKERERVSIGKQGSRLNPNKSSLNLTIFSNQASLITVVVAMPLYCLLGKEENLQN